VTRTFPRDLAAVAAAALLVAAAVLAGRHIEHSEGTLHVGWPPLYANWDPHAGPGTPAAAAVAVAVVAYGPAVAARLPWRALPVTAWAAAMAWTWSLALVDGWHRGVAVRLTTRYEYLRVIGRFHDIPVALRDFTHHILIGSPGHWPAHVAGHPPAATLTFVLLDRIGLGGGGWAGAWCVTAGATACAAVLTALRTLAGEDLARRAAPFLVLAPAAVWMGTSADGYFAAVACWAVALCAAARAARRRRRARAAAFGAGSLFGLTCYLSYGLTLFALIGAAALVLGRRGAGRPPWASAAAGLAVVPAVFTLAGFDWWQAYRLLAVRYYQGAGGIRPYGYWVWANLACTALVVGPATAAGLRRCAAVLVREGSQWWRGGRWRGGVLAPRPAPGPAGEAGLAALVTAAALALLIADLSGMSKAETERIWLPFAMWLLPACALLPRPRVWLAGQAVTALLLNHLLLTGW
jgi:methylthioxylose transferase